MVLKEIVVESFRLLKNFKLELKEDLSLIIGKNNCGKTSVLVILDKMLNSSEITWEDVNLVKQKELYNEIKGFNESVQEGNKFLEAIKLQLYIEYSDIDSYENIQNFIMDLDPENNIILLEFISLINIKNILELKDFSVSLKNNNHKVLNDINIEIREKEFLGIVGESGSGKTTLLNSIISFLNEKKLILDGRIILFENIEIYKMTEEQRKEICYKNISMILQDSINSLNPYEKIKKQLLETYLFHSKKKVTNDFAIKEIKKLLLNVGFEDIDRILNSYPNELSGGMRQRIAIVLVLCTDIKILLADEPTTSLDVVNQFRFIELLKKISKEKDLTLIYVSHDIKVLSKICERIIVLKDGNIVEENDTTQILKEPKNDYTKLLIKAATAD